MTAVLTNDGRRKLDEGQTAWLVSDALMHAFGHRTVRNTTTHDVDEFVDTILRARDIAFGTRSSESGDA